MEYGGALWSYDWENGMEKKFNEENNLKKSAKSRKMNGERERKAETEKGRNSLGERERKSVCV